MPAKHTVVPEATPDQLRWTLDPKSLPFKTTDDLEPLDEIVGQKRGVEAFRFGMGMTKKGYNIFVTGSPGSGRLATVTKLLKELSKKDAVPDDLCYVNNFKRLEEPILLRFPAGRGGEFKKAVHEFLENLKREIPQLFESEEYIARKNEIIETHEKKIMEFYQAVEEKVKNTGLAVVRMQMGSYSRPDVLPLVDGEPKRMVDLETMVENKRFPPEEYEKLREKRDEVKKEIDHIVKEVRRLQKEMAKRLEEADQLIFTSMAKDLQQPLRESFADEKTTAFLDAMLDDMAESMDAIKSMGAKPQGMPPGMPFMGPSPEAVMHPYQVNLLVDNAEREGPPIIIESYPTYRNLFGGIDRVFGPYGASHTDYSKISAGSFIKANGGYLVLNLMDAVIEPGVWQTLKRSLKTEKIEIQTYDPYYFLAGAGLKPEAIDMEVKVVVLGDPYLYQILRHYDQDVPKIFKVRADYESFMDNTAEAVDKVARFIRAEADKHAMRPFDATAVAAVVEQAVRMAGRREKISTAFPVLADLLSEADYYAGTNGTKVVKAEHVRKAIEAKVERSNQIEERIQEMIDRGSLFVDTDGAAVGQVNGLAVYSMGDYAFGKPSRITAVTAMGKEGVINIERESEMSGPTHNKGVLILQGYLRRKFAQDRPLTLTASIAFEQSYGGVDGDSASSTELYALLSSLSEIPLRQDIAVTGSVNQKGEVQPIGGVNEKIEGFYLACKHAGLTGKQGVMIPFPNLKDVMLKPEVIEAVKKGKFHVWPVKTIDEGIALLTGVKAGERDAKGAYPAGSINALAEGKLKRLAEGLRDFAGAGDEGKEKKKAKPKAKKAE